MGDNFGPGMLPRLQKDFSAVGYMNVTDGLEAVIGYFVSGCEV